MSAKPPTRSPSTAPRWPAAVLGLVLILVGLALAGGGGMLIAA